MPSGAFADTVVVVPTATQALVSGSRTLGTTYQNLTGAPMFVAVASESASTYTMSAYSDPSNAFPLASVQACTDTANLACSITFVVPPDSYYKVVNGGTTPVIDRWTEWKLGTTTISTATSTTATSTVSYVDNPVLDAGLGMILFLSSFWGMIWFFRKRS